MASPSFSSIYLSPPRTESYSRREQLAQRAIPVGSSGGGGCSGLSGSAARQPWSGDGPTTKQKKVKITNDSWKYKKRENKTKLNSFYDNKLRPKIVIMIKVQKTKKKVQKKFGRKYKIIICGRDVLESVYTCVCGVLVRWNGGNNLSHTGVPAGFGSNKSKKRE